MSTILHISPRRLETPSNDIASISVLRRHLQKGGWDLVLALPEEARNRDWVSDLEAEGFRIAFWPLGVKNWRRASRTIAGFANEVGAVLIHTHFSRTQIPGLLARRKLRSSLGDVPIVWHVHTTTKMTPTWRIFVSGFVKLRLLGRHVNLLGVSGVIASELYDSGARPGSVEVILNGVAHEHARRATLSRDAARDEMRIGDTDFAVLGFGWAPYVKGVDLMCDAVESLVDAGYRVILLLVGIEDTRKYIEDRYGDVAADWLRMIRPTPYVGNLYGAADAFVLPSRAEGFSYSLGEAMMNKLPIVVSDIPALDWSAQAPGVRRFKLDDGGSAGLAPALEGIMNMTSDERERAGEGNLLFVETEFSADRWATDIIRYYRKILGIGPGLENSR